MKNLGFHKNYNYFAILPFFKEFLFFRKLSFFFREILKLQKSPVCLLRSSVFSKIRYCSHKTLLILQNIQFVFCSNYIFLKNSHYFPIKGIILPKNRRFSQKLKLFKNTCFFPQKPYFFEKTHSFLNKTFILSKTDILQNNPIFFLFYKSIIFRKNFFFLIELSFFFRKLSFSHKNYKF